MDGWPYSAYNRLPSGAQPADAYANPGSSAQILLHHQLRQAQQQAQQAQISQYQGLPPSLVQAAAANNKSHLHQQALANLNMRESAMVRDVPLSSSGHNSIPPQSTSAQSSSNNYRNTNSNGLVIIPEPHKANRSSNHHELRQAAELKTSQPIFPGQPPPLSQVERSSSSSSSSKSYAQPPPRQSSQPPQRSNRTAFPGQQPPSSFREPSFVQQQQQQRPDLIIQRQQASPQQPSPQQMYNNPSPQSVASPQGYYQNPSPHERSSTSASSYSRHRTEERHRSRSSSKSKSQQTLLYQQQQQLLQQQQQQQQAQQQQQQLLQQQALQQQQQQQQAQQQQQQQQDLGLARLGALGALADLNDGNDLLNEVPSTINYEDLGLGGHFGQSSSGGGRQQESSSSGGRGGGGGSSKSESKSWLQQRASELLDLSSGDSRDTPAEAGNDFGGAGQQGSGGNNQSGNSQGQFIPQIVMNPWDPSQAPMMTFAPIANAVQAYQQQWLLQQQQAGLGQGGGGSGSAAANSSSNSNNQQDEEAAITHEMEEETVFKPKVVCISPDDEMGFLQNLPPPCNVVLQPSTIGLSGKVPESPFMVSFQKYLRGESTAKPAPPVDVPKPEDLPGKKKYIPPYTPNRTRGSSSSTHTMTTSRSGSNNRHRQQPHHSHHHTPSAASATSASGNAQKFQQQNFQKKFQAMEHETSHISDDDDDDDMDLNLPKRESSRRKAKDQSTNKRAMQNKLLQDDEDQIPGLDLSDSDEDATWTPFKGDKPGEAGAISRHKRLASDDEDDLEYRNAISTPKKPKKAGSVPFQTTSIVPPDQDFKPGDFVVLRDEQNHDKSPIWRFDSKTLVQRFNVAGTDETGAYLYKSANQYSGYINANRHKYVSLAVKFVSSDGPDTVVKILSNADSFRSAPDPEVRKRSYAETAQFQENFEVYIQALISQCLDSNFLDEVFNDQDEYFVSNIEKVDSVTLLRKDKVMIGVSWAIRFQQAITTWPCLNDLGASAVQQTKCGACERERAASMVQMFGQPYNQNTLKPVPPSEQASMNRNFSVCGKCGRLAQLFHMLHHQKHRMFGICSDVVEGRRKKSPGLDTTRMLNELLADDSWLEQQFRKMQDLWADADTFVR